MPFGGLLSVGIGAAGSALGGLFGGKGAKKAAEQQAKAQQAAIDFTKQQIGQGQEAVTNATQAGQEGVASGVTGANETLSDAQQKELALLQPFINAGTTSVGTLQDLAGANGPLAQKFSFNPTDLQNEPGYQFTLKQGQDAINKAAAARGGLFSGGTLKSLAQYNSGLADTTFNNAFNRAATTFGLNRQTALDRIGALQQLAQTGYGATTTGTNAIGQTEGQKASNTLQGSEFGANLGLTGAENFANLGVEGARAITGALTNQGNAQAAGTVGNTNSWLNALQNGSNSIIGYLGLKYPRGVPGVVSGPSDWSTLAPPGPV